MYLYANNIENQYSFIESAKAKGYSVLLMDGDLDTPMVSMLEQKLEKSRFIRVDGDVIDRLIEKEEKKENELSDEDTDILSQAFRSQLPTMEKANIYVEVQALGTDTQPVVITQSEYMRRMKDISRYQSGMAFYGEMPDTYSMVLNSDHPLVKRVLEEENAACAEALKPVKAEIKGLEARLAVLRQEQDKKKPEEVTQEEKDDVADTEKKVREENEKKKQIVSDHAKDNDVIHQLIDLALLQNGMLKGAALAAFLKRSVDMIK